MFSEVATCSKNKSMYLGKMKRKKRRSAVVLVVLVVLCLFCVCFGCFLFFVLFFFLGSHTLSLKSVPSCP